MNERKKTVTLVAFDPDGGEHKFRTAAQYDYAGLAKGTSGYWELVSKGWSQESVRSRAITRGEWGARIEVVKFSETTSQFTARQRAEIKARAERCEAAGCTGDHPDWAGKGFTRRNGETSGD